MRALLAPLAVAGLGIGLTFVPMTMAATTGVPPDEAGLASGLINTSRQLGGALGLAFVTLAGALSALVLRRQRPTAARQHQHLRRPT